MSWRTTEPKGPGLRQVIVVAVAVMLVVLAVEALSSLVPAIRETFRTFPLTVLVLVAGTGLVLALILRRPGGQG